ncbi:MAG TPA: hypothetical protein VKP64_16445, partial [Mycobacteriales bacterium]|nr:hypothetical protein [Mycobacteriales bacterium]
MHVRVRTILGVLGTLTMAVALGLFIPTAALAHPPGAHEREVLAQPAVVFIETAAQADIVLHDGGLTRATYDVPVLASGSGALVNRSGTVVTAAPVVAPDLTRAKVYAVNRLFARQYGAPSGDPFMRHRLSDPRLDQKLQGCYRPERLTSDCAVFVRPRIRVFPFLATPGPALGAELLRAGRRPTDPAVLAVSGVNMPTVALAPTLKGATAVSTLGFAAPPRARGNPASIDQHLAPAGSTKLAAADLAALRKGLPNAAGAVVIGSGSGAAVGLIGAAPGQTPTIVPVDAVRQTLQSLGIQPARSAVDTDFASAHSFFAGNHYSHAVPRLQEVLRLYPGHALAARELQIALEKKGTAADRSLADDEHGTHGAAPSTATTGGSRTNLVLLYAGLGLLVLALLLAFVFGRR